MVATEIGLDKHLLAFLEYKDALPMNTRSLGTTMEALLGAIHEDSGKDPRPVRVAMSRMGLLVPFKEIMRRRNSIKEISEDSTKDDEKLGSWRSLRSTKDLEGADADADANVDQELLDALIAERHKHIINGNPRNKAARAARRQAKVERKNIGFQRRGTKSLSLEARGASSADREGLEDADVEQDDLEDADAVREDFDDPTIDQELLDAQFNEGDLSEHDSLMGSGGTAMEPDLPEPLTDEPVWGQHGWVSQHCQITLEVAQSGRMIRRKT